jgi:hypothetical protein
MVGVPGVPNVTEPPVVIVVPINIPVVRLYALIILEVIPPTKFWPPVQLFVVALT